MKNDKNVYGSARKCLGFSVNSYLMNLNLSVNILINKLM